MNKYHLILLLVSYQVVYGQNHVVSYPKAQHQVIQSYSNQFSTWSKAKALPIKLDQLPIKAERTISFSTNEGTNIDLDISPDGKTIAFSLLGDLFTVPSSGGVAKQITRGLAVNQCPVWSPDGKLIAFESDATGSRRIHVLNPSTLTYKTLFDDPKGIQLMGGRPSIWLPENNSIIVQQTIFNISGSSWHLPKGLEEGKILDFSEDGRSIYVFDRNSKDSFHILRRNRISGLFDTIGAIKKSQHWRLNNPKISKDGKLFTYIKVKGDWGQTADSLMIIDLETSKERLLINFKDESPNSNGSQYYSFSKDSKFLYISYGGKIHRITVADGANIIVPFVANVKVDMGPLNHNSFTVSLDSFEVKYIRSVQRSPDGNQLLFSALNKIYKMQLPGGKPQLLVDQNFNQFQSTYSPDGKSILYVTWNDSEGGHIWRISTEGGAPERITDTAALYMNPSWSKDGKSIVVVKGSNSLSGHNPGTGKVIVISLLDKSTTIFADDVPMFNHPKFSRDGQSIIYKPSFKDDRRKPWPILVCQKLDKSRIDTLAIVEKTEERVNPLRQVILSPDYKYVVIQHQDNLYLIPIVNISFPQVVWNENSPIKVIRFARGAVDPNWEEDGKVLSWTSGNRFYRIEVKKIVEEAEYIHVNTAIPSITRLLLPLPRIMDVNVPEKQSTKIILKAARPYQTGIVALTNARIITMNKSQIIENGIVLIRNGRIQKVGDSKIVAVPREAKIYDLNGKTILPGFIDVHYHNGATEPDIFYKQSYQGLLNLGLGITTVRDPSALNDQYGYGELIEAGKMIGPRLYSSGKAVTEEYDPIMNLEDARAVVNTRVKMGGIMVKQYLQPLRIQRQLLQLACSEAGLNMTNELGSAGSVLSYVKDGSSGVEHNPDFGDIYMDMAILLARSGTFFTPTLQTGSARSYYLKHHGEGFITKYSELIRKKDFYNSKRLNEIKADSSFVEETKMYTKIAKAGGRIVIGSHGEDQGIGSHYELWALHKGGMTNLEALRTATITAAEALGIQKDLGSIEVGKIADLLVLDANPLENIHNTTSITYVLKSGILYSKEDLINNRTF